MTSKKPFVFTNADKDGIYEAHDMRNLGNHIRSSRILISGCPGSGKSNIVKNLIVNQEPPFEEIYIMHIDSSTNEYDQLNATIVTDTSDLPALEEIDGTKKILIIFEDLDYSSFKPKDITLLDKYLRFLSTHRGVSVYICCQNFYSLPAGMRRKIDIFYITKIDQATLSLMCRNFSLTKKQFMSIINCYMNEAYDNLCFDNSGHPVQIRKNIFTAIPMPKS